MDIKTELVSCSDGGEIFRFVVNENGIKKVLLCDSAEHYLGCGYAGKFVNYWKRKDINELLSQGFSLKEYH